MPAPPRRRNRGHLSCDRCRRLKRKCNRADPCSVCLYSKVECTWSGAGGKDIAGPRIRQRTIEHAQYGIISPPETTVSYASTSEAQRPVSRAPRSSSIGVEKHSLDTVLRLPGFANAVLTIWFRDLDWMYDILSDTDFEQQWRSRHSGPLLSRTDTDTDSSEEQLDSPRYLPVFLAVCAIVCQLQFSDLEAAILALGGECLEATRLGQQFYEEAASRVETAFSTERIQDVPLETFQASLLLCAFTKTAGNRGGYRDMLFRDISRLQRRGLHRQTSLPPRAEEALANRIFWAYFTYDRLYFMLEDLPYCMASQHADVWLQDHQGGTIQVQDLCTGGQSPQVDSRGQPAAHLSLSIYVTCMAKLAALVGRYTDRLGSLTQVLGLDPAILPEDIASQAGQELASLEQHIYQQITGEGQRPLVPGVPHRVASLHPSQHHIIAMTIAKIKRDIATRLIQHLQAASLMSVSLHYQRVHSASKLLQLALSVAAKIPLRQMGWGFFLFYTYEPIIELLESLRQSDFIGSIAAEHLSFALSGRNLLVMVARETKMSLAQRLLGEVCAQSALTLQQVGGVQQELIDAAKDPKTIVKVQKMVDSYRNCLSISPSHEGAFDPSSLILHGRSDSPSLAASMQALDELYVLLSNPVLG